MNPTEWFDVVRESMKDLPSAMFSQTIPNGYTWDWNPPTLIDRWTWDFPEAAYDTFKSIVQVGDVLLRQEHLYTFEFATCCGEPKIVKLKVPKKLVVEMVGTDLGLVWEAF
jgi:hypothetical protein